MRFGMQPEQCLRQLYVNFGEDAIYIAAGREPVVVRVIPEFGPDEILEETGVKVQAETRRVNVLCSEVSAPSKGDIIKVRGKDYSVSRVMPEDEGERELYLEVKD